MRSPWIWSVSLGRWWNVHVRLHMFFFLFAVFAIYLTSSSLLEPLPYWLGPACVVTWLVSVLLHEIGHVAVARRLGGVADEIVLSPLGGLGTVRVPYEPHAELVALMAGTLVNGTICFICAAALAFASDSSESLVELLRPTIAYFKPGPEPLELEPFLKLVFWVNWSLILVNLIPAFPFDGGRSLHALTAFIWPETDSRQTSAVICRVGKVISVVLLVIAWFQFAPSGPDKPQPPVWMVLSLLSIYVFFNSRREEMNRAEAEREDDTVFGYDFSQGYTSLERSLEDEDAEPDDAGHEPRPQPGFVARWLERRRIAKLEREMAQEAEDERRVDEVLERLHKHGMRNLSHDDKALLDRVSKRYRSRLVE